MTTADVFDPEIIEHYMRNLYGLAVRDSLELRVKKRDMFDGELLVRDIYPIANVVRMLYEEEDT